MKFSETKLLDVFKIEKIEDKLLVTEASCRCLKYIK
jgi:hypothetical protein